MSIDLIEIALDRFTDWTAFEKLAAEVMRDEGYPDISPLGGVHDEAQDAVVERFYLSDGQRMRVVFQFTLRPDVATKVHETIKRLDDAGVQFQKLVLVTKAAVSAETQREIKKEAKLREKVDLDIYERKTLVNRLGDLSNGLFHRYFPDIKRQLAAVYAARPAVDTAREKEREFLRVSLAFTFSPSAARSRKSLLDATVLALTGLRGHPVTPEEIVGLAREHLAGEVLRDPAQVTAALERLRQAGMVTRDDGGYLPALSGKARLDAASIALEAAGQAVVTDIVTEVLTAAGEPITNPIRTRLEQNAREVLAEYFRISGLELSNYLLNRSEPAEIPGPVYLTETPRLIEIARRNVGAHPGDLLVTAVGRALCTPSAEQAEYFAACSRAYLALAVMNADPALREFQRSRFGTKVFILDTDAVLAALIEDLPLSRVFRDLVARLVELGARVVVPEEVLKEVASHFEIAPNTFEYFGGNLAAINEELATSRIWNALVLGYWYRSRAEGKVTRAGFMAYRENYYDARNPLAFIAGVTREALPGTELGPVADVLGARIERDRFDTARRVLFDIVAATRKGAERTGTQNEELADRDALLLLSVNAFNAAAANGSASAILGKRAYVVTSSGRYVRAAARLGIDTAQSARPHILLGLLEMIGPTSISDREFVALFENSVLQQAVQACWDDVKVLLDAGVDLRDKSITRLRHDVERQMQGEISSLRRADSVGDEEEAPDTGDREHMALLDAAERLGYRPTRLLAEAREEAKRREAEIARLASENAELQEAVVRFGRKKARWLRRMRRQQEQEKRR